MSMHTPWQTFFSLFFKDLTDLHASVLGRREVSFPFFTSYSQPGRQVLGEGETSSQTIPHGCLLFSFFSVNATSRIRGTSNQRHGPPFFQPKTTP